MNANMSSALTSALSTLRGAFGRRLRIDAGDFLNLALLLTALSLALTLRLLNFRFGFFLSEFDPYWHYRSAEYISENGIMSFLFWRDYMSWVPGGRDVAISTPIGLPLFAAALQLVLALIGIGVDLMTLTILIPPISGIFAALSVYFFAKELASREAGIVAAILIAFNGSHIERTHLGFFKHETLGIPLIVLTLLFYLKAAKSGDDRRVWSFSILSGLSLGYLAITWTGYVYAAGLVALLTAALTLLSLVDPSKMLVIFSVVQGLFMAMASLFPRSQGEMLSISLAISLAAFGSIIIKREMDRVPSLKAKASLLVGIFAVAALLALVGVQVGLLSGLYGKLVVILNPGLRTEQAIIESVSEHKVSNWFNLFSDHGPTLLLFSFSLLTSLMSPNLANVFILLTGASSLYFSTMMVRLGLIFSPFSTSFASIGGQRLIAGIFPGGEEAAPIQGRRARRRGEAIGFSWVALSGLLVVGLLAPSVVTGLQHAGGPVTIAGASLPFGMDWPDWLETVAWIRENTPPGSVIMSWWDYGYWITTLGNRPTIIDNATINTTQVALVGKAFISNNTVALPIMKRLNVSYVVVFTTLPYNTQLGFWGDEVKWIWMAEIGYYMKTEPSHNETFTLFGDYELSQELADEGLLASSDGVPYILLPKRDFVLTKLMILSSFGPVEGFVEEDPHFTLVFRARTIKGYPGMVSIFKVNYEYEVQTTTQLSASSSDNKTDGWTWTDEYPLGVGTRVSFRITDVDQKNGTYDINGTVLPLNSSVRVSLVDSSGAAVFSATPMVGLSSILIHQDRLELSLPGQPTMEIPVNFSGPLTLSFKVYADILPEGVQATIIQPATATIKVTYVKYEPAAIPGS